jgi:hypothetical protein
MLIVGFEPKHFPGNMKAGDLTTTVAKYLAIADQSADDLIEVFGWLSLTEWC